ncbi:50S ribosomal protein L25/general stress protein Ctc [SAR92 clade bacterium H231]|jgi:large subunit ribosomal protein L25|nr:50S ribosomal protein L25/general stress protein Ctc [SAR92 clade bacterium H231]MDA7816162.1 50S ribosomal protein L25/general stress protein Ctc [Porticoccaceae bacterium]MDA8903385.1 50S ribosomal protein L25/general stress protein Ctc [Porticoccaceae bacterium]MDA8936720.1 50S ribosomal protein L25/general stress protein Ctc [Porticoccaceae bacterium]MDA9839338.1 50S ribosomal protein L25/general stress protein Ctc [Porticoccaceae bacterium]
MSTDFTLHAKGREDTGKGASRRLRRLAGEIPAIVYGGKKDPARIALIHKDVMKALENEAFYSHIIALDIDGKSEDVIVKDVQRHPAKSIVLHMDFLRVSKNTKLQTRVPLHFINEESCVGVKLGGGLIAHSMTELEIMCLPADLPEYLEVDMAEVEIGQTLHISDIKLPKGVESVALSHGDDHDLPIAAVNKSKAKDEDEEAAPAADAGAGEADSSAEEASEE